MKLNPKHSTFCPGCPSTLSLKNAPQFIIKMDKPDTKKISILTKSSPKKEVSLF